MSSGSIESGEYHRAQRLGEGGFGSVRTVYDNDGQVYAVRSFFSLFFHFDKLRRRDDDS